MIHYHGTPLTPVKDMARAFAGRHAMVSFGHPEQMEVAAEVCHSFVLDNGAFSAWMQNKPYDFAGFSEWCCKWVTHPAMDWFVIPDVIDGSEDENDRLLEGYKQFKYRNMGVPVWHLHESLDRLTRLVDDYERVCLGSSGHYAQIQTPAWWARMAEAMELLCDSRGMPLVKIHGLRMLDPVLFAHIPFASADSCNVARNVGLDSRWGGPYAPTSKWVRALVLMDRIESHASAARWCGSNGVQQNMELAG